MICESTDMADILRRALLLRRTRQGLSAVEAQSAVAREMRVTKGRLINILKTRIKRFDLGLKLELRRVLAREIDAQIKGLIRERETILAGDMGRDRRPRGIPLAEIEADVARLKKLENQLKGVL